MFKRFISFIFIQYIIITLCSCNSDLFLSDTQLPDDTVVNIEGDGGQFSTAISCDGLQAISIIHDYDDRKNFSYYDINGNITSSECPVEELREIHYETLIRSYSLGIEKKMLYFNSYYNCDTEAFQIVICLKYDFGNKYLTINLSEGAELKVTSWEYDSEMIVTNNISFNTYSQSFNNGSSLKQHFIIRPYVDCKAISKISTEESVPKYLTADVPVPVFTDQEGWAFKYDNSIPFNLEIEVPFDYIDEFMDIPVEPNSLVKVSYKVNYSRCTIKGKIYLLNPVTDIVTQLPITTVSIFPSTYDTHVQIIK